MDNDTYRFEISFHMMTSTGDAGSWTEQVLVANQGEDEKRYVIADIDQVAKGDQDYYQDNGPAGSLREFINVCGDPQKMWALMGPGARAQYGSADKLDYTAFAEGLGAFKYSNYKVIREEINGTGAVVEIAGDVEQEGNFYKDKHYTANMTLVNGQWKWDIK